MPVKLTDSRVSLTHPNGSTAEVLLYGATVISWCAPSRSLAQSAPTERLYTSSTALLDGSKPVRGGIPLVFPFFGPPSKDRPEHDGLTQHGYARSTLWTYDSTVLDDDAGVSVRFQLPARTPFPALSYTLTLAAYQLTSALHILPRPGDSPPPPFQALFHTYLRASAPTASITPLSGKTYIDKLQGAKLLTEQRPTVDVRKPADSVYKDAGGRYEVDTGRGKVSVHATGVRDVVVWNPGPEAGRSIKDLEDGGWDMFVAVEPGAASYWIELAPTESWIGQQVLTVE